MPDTGLDRVTMGRVLVTFAHGPQPPRPTLMERRCWVASTAGRSHRDRVRRFWVTSTAFLLPLGGWWRRTRSSAGNDIAPPLIYTPARVGQNPPGIIQPIHRRRCWVPPAGNGHHTHWSAWTRSCTKAWTDCLICASPLPLGGSFTRLIGVTCFPMAQAHLMIVMVFHVIF